MVLAASKGEEEVSNPTTVEILAIFCGLQLCANMGIGKLIIGSDCLMMVYELQDNSLLCPTMSLSARNKKTYAAV